MLEKLGQGQDAFHCGEVRATQCVSGVKVTFPPGRVAHDTEGILCEGARGADGLQVSSPVSETLQEQSGRGAWCDDTKCHKLTGGAIRGAGREEERG